eukprot:COSAG01_NODE_676_length_14324_cov_17.420105_2_plen_38_part_00
MRCPQIRVWYILGPEELGECGESIESHDEEVICINTL